MTITIDIKGIQELNTKLKSLVKKYGKEGANEGVVVGFSQNYAIYVHEVQAYHKVGQWKYLETPARQLHSELGSIVQRALSRGTDLRQSLMPAGLRLQRAAQLLTPVDTSALKASAFTCFERDLEGVAKAAYYKSELIRLSGKKKP